MIDYTKWQRPEFKKYLLEARVKSLPGSVATFSTVDLTPASFEFGGLFAAADLASDAFWIIPKMGKYNYVLSASTVYGADMYPSASLPADIYDNFRYSYFGIFHFHLSSYNGALGDMNVLTYLNENFTDTSKRLLVQDPASASIQCYLQDSFFSAFLLARYVTAANDLCVLQVNFTGLKCTFK